MNRAQLTSSMTLRRAGAAAFAPLAIASLALTGCGSSSSTSVSAISVPTTFTSVDGPGGAPTTINGISNKGVVVGFTTANNVNSNFERSATGTFTNLTLGDPAGMANGINDAGTVVGVANTKAFTMSGSTLTPLTIAGSTSSVAFGINDTSTIVGQDVVGANTPGFVDVGGNFTTVMPTNTATVVNVQGINNRGMAIGFYSADGVHQHGFAYNTLTKVTTLLPDPSTARITTGGLVLTQFLGINDGIEAVGYYQTNNGSQFGFLFNLATNTYTYLDDPLAAPVSGVQITQITGVDDSGEICGFFIDAGGVQHGFIAK